MLPPLRRDAARSARGLALLIAALSGGAGCSHPPLLAAPHRFVRLDALLPLHPSWVQVQSLDREVARLQTAPAQSLPLRYEPYPALHVLVPSVITPASRASERIRQVDRDAQLYDKSLENSLDVANREIMSLETRREKRRVEAAVTARLAQAATTLRNDNAANSFAILQRLRTLSFSDIVAQSRVQDLAQAHSRDTRALREAQAQRASILAEIDRLKVDNRALVTQDVVKETGRKRADFYREEDVKSKERLAQRAEELETAKQDKIKAEVHPQRDTVIPPPAAPELPAVDPRATPLPLPVDSVAALTSARSPVAPALGRQAILWRAQRSTLVAEIRADTLKAVQQVALRRGWKLVPAQAPGARDGTDEAADDIRAQWRIGKGP